MLLLLTPVASLRSIVGKGCVFSWIVGAHSRGVLQQVQIARGRQHRLWSVQQYCNDGGCTISWGQNVNCQCPVTLQTSTYSPCPATDCSLTSSGCTNNQGGTVGGCGVQGCMVITTGSAAMSVYRCDTKPSSPPPSPPSPPPPPAPPPPPPPLLPPPPPAPTPPPPPVTPPPSAPPPGPPAEVIVEPGARVTVKRGAVLVVGGEEESV